MRQGAGPDVRLDAGVSAHDVLAATVAREGPRILATLIRTVGDVCVAQDAVQEACLAALATWSDRGVPPEPRAWLTLTARRKAIDALRREQARGGKEVGAVRTADLGSADLPGDDDVRDDLLRLVFTCCHPALSPPTRVALALRTLCGLSPAQVAGVLMTGEAAVTRRLTRARQKIAAANIPYRVPSREELPGRLPAVCAVVHGLYTAGHAPITGDAVADTDACIEAVRLAELLHELLPGEPMPTAVLALLLFTEARRTARTDDEGEVVTLDRQDRTRWDHALISRGRELLDSSLSATNGQADPYQLQAAIAAEHASAPAYDATDWAELVRLYDLLLSVAPSPAGQLARAVAVAEALGAAAGLAALDGVVASPRRHAVRGELLAREGRCVEAVEALTASLDGDVSAPERRYRVRRREDLARRLDDHVPVTCEA